jgi:hypothetical protein
VMHRRPTQCEYSYVSGRLPGLSRWRLDGGSMLGLLVYLVCSVYLVCLVERN